jgi:hypothetical protein
MCAASVLVLVRTWLKARRGVINARAGHPRRTMGFSTIKPSGKDVLFSGNLLQYK